MAVLVLWVDHSAQQRAPEPPLGASPHPNGVHMDQNQETDMPDQDELLKRVEGLEAALATQTATLAGAQATQAATTAGMTSTAAATQAGNMSTMTATQAGNIATMVAGSAGWVAGIFLGLALAQK
jgi:hypothetical protein